MVEVAQAVARRCLDVRKRLAHERRVVLEHTPRCPRLHGHDAERVADRVMQLAGEAVALGQAHRVALRRGQAFGRRGAEQPRGEAREHGAGGRGEVHEGDRRKQGDRHDPGALGPAGHGRVQPAELHLALGERCEHGRDDRRGEHERQEADRAADGEMGDEPHGRTPARRPRRPRVRLDVAELDAEQSSHRTDLELTHRTEHPRRDRQRHEAHGDRHGPRRVGAQPAPQGWNDEPAEKPVRRDQRHADQQVREAPPGRPPGGDGEQLAQAGHAPIVTDARGA